MKIDQTTIDDAKTYGKTEVINETLKAAEEALKSGGSVKITRTYTNAPEDTLEVVTTLDRLKELESSWLGYRNINAFVKDASNCITISPSSRPIEWSELPDVGDKVALDTEENYSIIVEVTEIPPDHQTLRGRVTNGYYPSKQEQWIEEGTMVEFSKTKVGGIHKQ